MHHSLRRAALHASAAKKMDAVGASISVLPKSQPSSHLAQLSQPLLSVAATLNPSFHEALNERFAVPRESSMAAPVLIDEAKMLFKAELTFDADGKGKMMQLDAVYQDTQPAGSALGTVVFLHGSPGSYEDYATVTPHLVERGIRVVAVNFPGFGLSEDDYSLTHRNTERNAFVQALVDGLRLREKIIFVGHSRASENALQMSAQNVRRIVGAILVGPSGFRKHRAMSLIEIIKGVNRLYEAAPFLRPAIHFALFHYYNYIRLRLKNGRIAANAIRSMEYSELADQKSSVDILNREGSKRVVIAYAGRDPYIEKPISKEFVKAFANRAHVMCPTRTAEDMDTAIEETVSALLESKKKTVSVEFAQDGHFIPKHRGLFLAETAAAMLKAAELHRIHRSQLKYQNNVPEAEN